MDNGIENSAILNLSTGEVCAPRLMAFIADAVAAILGRASCGQYGFDGVQWPF